MGFHCLFFRVFFFFVDTLQCVLLMTFFSIFLLQLSELPSAGAKLPAGQKAPAAGQPVAAGGNEDDDLMAR